MTQWCETRPSLRSVKLHAMSPTRATMQALSKIPTLTELHIWNSDRPSDEEFRDLSPMSGLRSLTWSFEEIQPAQWLSSSTTLRELDITSSTHIPEVMQCDAGLKELETLLLLGCENLAAAAFQYLIGLPRLNTLAITTRSITWESLETLRRLPRLERIVFEGGQTGGWIFEEELREAFHREADARGWKTCTAEFYELMLPQFAWSDFHREMHR